MWWDQTTSFMLKPYNFMVFLAPQLLQFSKKLPKKFHTPTHMLQKRGTISRTIRTWQSGPMCFHNDSFTQQSFWPSGCSQSGLLQRSLNEVVPMFNPSINNTKLSFCFGSMAKHIAFDLTFHDFYHFPRPLAGNGWFCWGFLLSTGCKDAIFNFADLKGHF